MISPGALHQLGHHPDTITESANAAFENVLHVQHLADQADVLLSSPKQYSRAARGYAKMRDFDQLVQDLFGQPIAKIFVLFIGAEIGERQYSAGGRRLPVRSFAL